MAMTMATKNSKKSLKKRPIISGIVGGVLFALLQLVIDYLLMGGNPSIRRIIAGGVIFGALLAFLVSRV